MDLMIPILFILMVVGMVLVLVQRDIKLVMLASVAVIFVFIYSAMLPAWTVIVAILIIGAMWFMRDDYE